MYEMIFFDFYGTIVKEDDDYIQKVISHIIDNTKTIIKKEEILSLWNHEFKRLMNASNENNFLSIKEIEIKCIKMISNKVKSKINIEEKAEIIFNCWRKPEPKTGIKDLLLNLKCKYFIVSNTDDDEIHQAIKYLKINPYAIITSEETKSYKPDHRIFDIALEKSKISPEKILFIGDSYFSDIYGSHNVGIDSLWLNWRNSKKKERHYKYISSDVSGMKKKLSEIGLI